MKKLVTVCMMLSLVSVASAAYIETFDSSNAGWLAYRTNDSGNVTADPATYNSSGGNPGGYISGSLSASGARLYTLSAVSSWGDITGETLTVDYEITGEVTAPANAKVRFYIADYDQSGSDYFITKDAYSWNPNTDTNGATHQVALLEANFMKSGYTTRSFAGLIADGPPDIGLVFTDDSISNHFAINYSALGFTGNGTINIDNFGTVVPEPATMVLLGLGGLLLRRKRKA